MTEFSSINQINCILDDEQKTSKQECWGKLSKKQKHEKLLFFSVKYCVNNKCDKNTFDAYIKQSLDRKKLNKKTDVKYNKETQEVEEIYNLLYHKQNKKFTIKKQETQKKTIKNKTNLISK